MDAITFFLTYPQSSFDHVSFHSFLNTIKPVVWLRVSTEKHEDGNDHIHAIVRFGARVKTRSNHTIFDFLGRHPNIQCPRKLKDVLEYVAKDGHFSDFGPVPGTINTFDELVRLAKANDRDAYTKFAMENRVQACYYADIWQRHSQRVGSILEPTPGIECMSLQQLHFDGRSTLIIGPTGCGKSTWAKRVAPKPALWVTHLDHLKRFDAHYHASIIFDDMSFLHLPREAQIHIVDQDDFRTIHCRHTVADIPPNIPKIFTANQDIFLDDPAIKRRLKTIKISTFYI